MKDSMLKFMKYALVGLGVLLALLVVVGVVLAMDWPWWVALFLVLLIAGGVIGSFVARRIMARRREQAFATDVAAEEEKRIAKLPAADLGNARLLRERWKDAVDTLKNSHLKKQGNPLYVLPWYLVIGESGSGKTTSLSSARLPSPFGAGRGNSAVSGTMNCDWWFCEESIIIDTAGRYSVPVDETRDREEWSNFLRLLSKYRRREPLNGVVLTVSADRLLDGGDERLEEEGRTMRRRMDELMRSLGVRVPVYLLVTKCDLIRGMTRFSSLLPEKILTQPMGMMKQDEVQDPEVFARAAMKTVGERLRNLRLLLLRERPQTDSAVLLFPEEFQSMTEGLASFMKGAFRENPYQETPFLRGVFFGSGRQEGRERSRFAADLREAGDEPLPGTARGFFLHDLFARILPSERALLAPTKKFMEWQHATGNLALVSFVVVAIALSGLLTFSFVRNLNTIRGFSRQFATIPGLKGEMVNVSEMERFRQAILKVEEGNRNWWIPRFGLTESLNVEASLKKAYCRRFHDNFLAGVDRQLLANLQGMTEATPDEQFGRTVLHLARRINILNARRDGKNLDKMASMPQPPYLAVSLEEGKLFGPLYLSYIQWLSETGDLGRDLETLQAGLKRLVPVKGTNVRWLATAVDNHSGLPAITLGDYWNGASPTGMPFISPSFTAKGKQAAEVMSAEIVSALGDSGSLLRRDDFRRWYGAAVQEQWRAFAVAFPRGIDGLKGDRSWQDVAVKMSTSDNPCFSFLARVGSELTALSEGAPQQEWVAQTVRLQQARLAGKAAPLTKAAEGGKKVLAGFEKVVGKDTQVQQFDVTSGPRGWVEYTTALAAIAPAAASRNQAYQLTAQVFADPGAPTPFRNAFQAAEKLSRFAGNGLPADDAVARLVWTPADFLWKHVRKETAALLQAQWDEQVVAGTAGLPPQQAMALLAGPDGTAWRFVKGPAAPFLSRSGGRGFYPREALGGTIPLDVSLFSFLEKGAKAQVAVMMRQANYNVGIKGLPTEANGEAKAQPHGTRLELQCAGAPQVLVNNNYPVGKTFYWSPDTCSDVSLQIEVGDVTVSKRYMGTTGFSDFLQDFHSGQRTFSSREFPGERQALEKLGIKYIKVNYLFTGGGAVLKQATALNGAVPRSIAR